MASKRERKREIGRERKRYSPAFIRGVTTLLLFCLVSGISGDIPDTCDSLQATYQSVTLIDKINSRRRQLPAKDGESRQLTAVKTLCYVAMKHVKDLTENDKYGQAYKTTENDVKCNNHSWGFKKQTTPTTTCCYTSKPSAQEKACMWNKPVEFDKLWQYGNGYEIVAWHSAKMTPDEAMRQWSKEISEAHYNVTMERGPTWSKHKFKRVGAAVLGKFGVVWFSD